MSRHCSQSVRFLCIRLHCMWWRRPYHQSHRCSEMPRIAKMEVLEQNWWRKLTSRTKRSSKRGRKPSERESTFDCALLQACFVHLISLIAASSRAPRWPACSQTLAWTRATAIHFLFSFSPWLVSASNCPLLSPSVLWGLVSSFRP